MGHQDIANVFLRTRKRGDSQRIFHRLLGEHLHFLATSISSKQLPQRSVVLSCSVATRICDGPILTGDIAKSLRLEQNVGFDRN